jgi:hypothetical protein
MQARGGLEEGGGGGGCWGEAAAAALQPPRQDKPAGVRGYRYCVWVRQLTDD